MSPTDEEAQRMMAEAGIDPGAAGERSTAGALVAAELHVQCLECLNHGVETILAPVIHNGMDLENEDLRVVCPACTQRTGITTVIPFDVLVGEYEVEQHEAALDLLDRVLQQGGIQAMDSAPPFANAGELQDLPPKTPAGDE